MKIKTIKSKFILAFVLSLTTVLAVTVIIFSVGLSLSLNSYIKKTVFSMQETVDEGVTEVVNGSCDLYGRIVRSENVASLHTVADSSLEYDGRAEAFGAVLERAVVNGDYFNDVALILDDTSFSMKGNTGLAAGNYSFLKENKNFPCFVGVERGSVVIGIYSENVVTDFAGIFLFYVNETRISEMCTSSEAGYSFIMCGDGLVVSHPDAAIVGKTIIYSDLYSVTKAPEYKTDKVDGKKSIIVISQAEVLNWYGVDGYIISVLDYKFYFGKMETTVGILIGTSVGVFALAVVIAVLSARKISKPITALSDKINSDTEPTKEHKSVLANDDELVQLERNYDEMMDRIYDLLEKTKEDAQLQRKLELDSLQMQINPHFLYNTLDAIAWMAKIKKQPEIEKLVMNLARFFRMSLHNGDKFVTVEDEVELVKSYLEIDKIRFPDRVQTHYEIDKEVGGFKILKLILQPLVENCVKYAYTEGGGNLWIRAYKKEGDIFLEVEDDGVGFDVPDDILTRPPKKNSGYGLKNVNERIRLQYGDEYGLTVESSPGQGTKFTARLKIIEE